MLSLRIVLGEKYEQSIFSKWIEENYFVLQNKVINKLWWHDTEAYEQCRIGSIRSENLKVIKFLTPIILCRKHLRPLCTELPRPLRRPTAREDETAINFDYNSKMFNMEENCIFTTPLPGLYHNRFIIYDDDSFVMLGGLIDRSHYIKEELLPSSFHPLNKLTRLVQAVRAIKWKRWCI